MNYCQNTRNFLKIFCFIRNYNYFTLIQLQHHLQKNNNKKLLEIQTINQPAFTCLKLTIETLEQRCEICSKLTIKPPKRRRCHFGGFIVNFEHISHLCSSISIAKFQHVIVSWVTKSMGIVKTASPFFKQHFRL